MKKVLIALLLTALFAVSAQAKTATITYDYTDFVNNSVIVWVAETPDIGGATIATYGQTDVDENGSVDIANIQPGKTYYFRARAYNKITGIPSNWSNEEVAIVPSETLPTPVELPPIPVTPGMTITISVN